MQKAYKVPFVDYPVHYRSLEGEIDAAIKEVLSNGDLILRSEVRQFESDIASFLNVEYAVGVSSGTDALHLSLVGAGVVHGDEVITVAHTFVATVAAIVHSGAKPILVDIGDDMDMDVEQVEQAITPKTKAIIPVHLNGRMCDMGKVMAIADEHRLTVVEDAAQALGATFDGKKAGSFGLTGCFSFYPAKMLGAVGDAGLVVTNSEEMAGKIRTLRDHGRETKDDLTCFGFTNRLDNLQAAVLDVKLRYLPEWIERRREIANLYYQGLSDLPELKLPPSTCFHDRFFDVYQNYVIRSEERDQLTTYLKESGIETLISWRKPMHRHDALGLGHFNLPKTEQLSDEVISLPMYPELRNEQIRYVVDAIHKFYRFAAEGSVTCSGEDVTKTR